MSFTEMLEQLETLSSEQRQAIIDRVCELDGSAVYTEHAKLIEERLQAYDREPDSGRPLGEVLDEIQKRLAK